MAKDIEQNNMTELLSLLLKHGFCYEVQPVSVAQYHEGHLITARIQLIEYIGCNKRVMSEVFWVPDLDCLHDPHDELGICDMDAQEVCVWWLNEFRDQQIMYGDA